jgi:uncharacterized protein (TIGR00661 family)
MIKINTGNPPGKKLRILVAPLDWGLGHATRCIPVIRELIAQGADTWLAGEGAQESLLRQEFPGLPFLPLRGYRVQYGRSATGLLKNIFFQVPRLLRVIKKEHRWLQNAVREYSFDAVISDNRFGLYHPAVPAVFITHQLAIKSPLGKWSAQLLQKNNYRYINRFTACWIPDEAGVTNLAGELSHPQMLPAVPVHYTGPLSRLKKTNTAGTRRHLFISLSGPEPQRTVFENRIIDDISHYNGTAVIVRGLPGKASVIPSTNDIRFYNHLSTDEYNNEMERAEYVISRSGYSTVMDLVALEKKSILVPTPGQTEQEYLAKSLMKQKIACSIPQKNFSLQEALQAAHQFDYRMISSTATGLPGIVSAFLRQLQPPVQEPAFG